MNEQDKQLLVDRFNGFITDDFFLSQFSVDIRNDSNFARKEIENAITKADPEEIQSSLYLIWLSADIIQYVDLLNELLINPNHKCHQLIAKTLQDKAPSPTTVPYIRKALESNFDYLAYTYSESAAIAKWFSWLLYSIGTTDAIDLMKEFCNSHDEGIRNEMLYRLKKI